MSKGIAVVLMSGGMDSTVTAALARASGYEVAGLHLRYGQRTAARELQAFHDVCNHYAIGRRLVLATDHLRAIGGSSLTDSTMDVSPADISAQAIPSSYVPFRNAAILSMATAWAEVLAAEALYIGAVEEDGSGYPDCRKEFFSAFQRVIDTGTKPDTRIRLATPLIELSKAQIVQQGIALNAPLHLSWSCYAREDSACGECDSCALRLRGFAMAGVADPLPYRKRPAYPAR